MLVQTPRKINDDALLDHIYVDSVEGSINLDEIMVSAVQKGRHKGVDPVHLAKIWRIDEDIAKKTIDITTQRSVRKDYLMVSRNYGTNDRMLRYKHLKEYFYMDTLFATKIFKKSSRGNICAQLFVTDKLHVYVVLMTKESNILQTIKYFVNTIGAPDAIIFNAAKAQHSKAIKCYCNNIGTPIRLVERNNPWENKP